MRFDDLYLVCAGFHEELHQVVAAKHSGEHEGSAAIAVLQVDVGAVLNEHFGDGQIAFEADAHERRVARSILRVGVGTSFEQELRGV